MRGQFLGEETSGGYYGNTSGMSTTATLPNTGITVSIPMLKYVMAVSRSPERARGILPDHEVVPTIRDVLDGSDPVLAKALEQIRKSGD